VVKQKFTSIYAVIRD